MESLLWLHAAWRWFVLVLAGLVTLKALLGWLRRQPFGQLDNRLGMTYTMVMDLQVFFGLILWFFGPFGLRNLAQAMGNAGLRFIVVEHPVLILLALALAHIGRARSRKATADVARHQAGAIFYGLSFLLVALVFVPR